MTEAVDLVKLREWLAVVEVDRDTLDLDGLRLWNAAHTQLDMVSPDLARKVIEQADRIEALEEDLAETRLERDIAVAALRSGADKRDFLLRAFVRKSAALTQARKTSEEIREIAGRPVIFTTAWDRAQAAEGALRHIAALAQPHTAGEKNHG